MASNPPKGVLPIMYEDLEPITKEKHGNMKFKRLDKAPKASTVHAVPVTVEEIPLLQRFFPIVFTAGDNMLPIALMGLNEGANAFLDEDGNPVEKNIYLPAYLRRYPFMLARLKQDSEELSLCVDPTAGVIGDFKDGEPIFDGDQPSEFVQNILKFCENFEQGGMEKPYLYRGFRMVNEEKFRELKGDQLRKMNQNGMLAIIMAHLFSLSQIREVFTRQVRAGKGPVTVEELEGSPDQKGKETAKA
jgi:hypothetical protein